VKLDNESERPSGLPERAKIPLDLQFKKIETAMVIFCFAASIAILVLVGILWGIHDKGKAIVEGGYQSTGTGGAPISVLQLGGANESFMPPLVSEIVLPEYRGTSGTWSFEDGERYYLLPDGQRATGVIDINGVEVCFDEFGRWQWTYLNVPYISQLPDMPYGCEVVSVTMMLNYAGVEVTKEEVAEVLPYADDPEYGFTGTLYDDWDWDWYWGWYSLAGIVWPPALLELVYSFAGSAVDLTGSSWREIEGWIDSGKPVCIWFTDWYGYDHTVLLIGYSATQVWLNDPLNGEDYAMDLEEFFLYWEWNGYRALSY